MHSAAVSLLLQDLLHVCVRIQILLLLCLLVDQQVIHI